MTALHVFAAFLAGLAIGAVAVYVALNKALLAAKAAAVEAKAKAEIAVLRAAGANALDDLKKL